MKIRKYKNELVEVIDNVLCDACKREIQNDIDFEFSAHHYDWDNDSIDSYEYYDVCSFKCFLKKLQEIYE